MNSEAIQALSETTTHTTSVMSQFQSFTDKPNASHTETTLITAREEFENDNQENNWKGNKATNDSPYVSNLI